MSTELIRIIARLGAVRHWAAAGAAVIGFAALAGCGSKGSDKPVVPVIGGGAKTVVHLAFFPNVTHAAALVGTARGTFAQALAGGGASLEEKTFTAGPSEIEALFAGAVDIGYIGPGPALNGYLKSNGQALKIIAGASSGGAGLVVRNGVVVESLHDLAGKRIAVPQTGGTQDISLRHILQDTGLKTKDKGGNVDVVQYAPADIETRMQSGEVDAAWLPEPWITRLVQDKAAALFLDERVRWPGHRFATTVVVVRSDFLRDHADLVRRFLAAHIETAAWTSEHKDEAAALVSKRIAEITKKALPESVVRAALDRTDITADPLRESVLTFADWSKALGYQRQGREALTNLFDTSALEAVRVATAAPALQEKPK